MWCTMLVYTAFRIIEEEKKRVLVMDALVSLTLLCAG